MKALTFLLGMLLAGKAAAFQFGSSDPVEMLELRRQVFLDEIVQGKSIELACRTVTLYFGGWCWEDEGGARITEGETPHAPILLIWVKVI